jgi:hypothetical protein
MRLGDESILDALEDGNDEVVEAVKKFWSLISLTIC